MGKPAADASGVIGSVAGEAELDPIELVAVTVQVYVAPLINPDTVTRGEALVPE